VIKLQ